MTLALRPVLGQAMGLVLGLGPGLRTWDLIWELDWKWERAMGMGARRRRFLPEA